ncbi:50S ribosomal protein L33 [Ureaplasma canigenitalium]|uniref:50S ribosomal protein L33 n=1 Tax=Ureaplasma canigenitalium TaxID=42092 RepID=UPI00247FED0C|nr:50S ribosomal protein L33 [Ureaplasma canigenitalium]
MQGNWVKKEKYCMKVILVCNLCSSRNYQTERSKYALKRLELNKFCKHCNQQTLHKEQR